MVHANAVCQNGEGRIGRQGRQGALGRAIGVDEGLSCKCRNGADAADSAFYAIADHRLNRGLHEEVGAADVGGKDTVEEFRRGIDDSAPLSARACDDEDIYSAKLFLAFGDDGKAVLNFGKVSPHELRFHSIAIRQALGDCCAVLGVATGDDDSRRPGGREPPRDGCA